MLVLFQIGLTTFIINFIPTSSSSQELSRFFYLYIQWNDVIFKIDFSRRFVLKYSREGAIFIHHHIANFPLNLLVKEFWRSVNILQGYCKNEKGAIFYAPQCMLLVFSYLTLTDLLIAEKGMDELLLAFYYITWFSVFYFIILTRKL